MRNAFLASLVFLITGCASPEVVPQVTRHATSSGVSSLPTLLTSIGAPAEDEAHTNVLYLRSGTFKVEVFSRPSSDDMRKALSDNDFIKLTPDLTIHGCQFSAGENFERQMGRCATLTGEPVLLYFSARDNFGGFVITDDNVIEFIDAPNNTKHVYETVRDLKSINFSPTTEHTMSGVPAPSAG